MLRKVNNGKKLTAIGLLAVFITLAVAVPAMAVSPPLGFWYSKTYGGYVLSMNHYSTQYLISILQSTASNDKKLELIEKYTGIPVNYARILISMGAVIIKTADKGYGVYIVFDCAGNFTVKSRQ